MKLFSTAISPPCTYLFVHTFPIRFERDVSFRGPLVLTIAGITELSQLQVISESVGQDLVVQWRQVSNCLICSKHTILVGYVHRVPMCLKGVCLLEILST